MKWPALVLSVLCCLGSFSAFAAAPAGANVQIDPSVRMEKLDDYYITKGSTYDKITALLQNLPPEASGLSGEYYFRIEKKLTHDYFYHVKAYDTNTHVQKGNYFFAKDESCVWRLEPTGDAAMIYGSAENLLKKTEIVVYPKKIALGSYGIIRVHVPGMLPYDIKLTSLNAKVAQISDKMNIVPVSAGKTDIVVDLKIGSATRTFTETVSIIDTSDDGRNRGMSPSVGIGIGVGWGSGWHHGGGIGIGVGPWW